MEMAAGGLAALFAVGVLAGIVDAIAGGGGLITLPVLVMAGLSPIEAVATNKIQALSSVTSSAYRYGRAGMLSGTRISGKLAVAVCGAAAGSAAVQFSDPGILNDLMPIILITVATFFFFSPRFLRSESAPLIGEGTFRAVVVPFISFYDGFFGPGTGSLYAAAFVAFLSRDLRRATAETKALNCAGSLIAAFIFIWGGAIVWPAALAMAAGAIVGAQFGAHIALRFGAPVIRPLLVVVSITLALRLLLVDEVLGSASLPEFCPCGPLPVPAAEQFVYHQTLALP